MKTKLLFLIMLVAMGSCVPHRKPIQYRKYYDRCPTYSSVEHWRYIDKTLDPEACNHVKLF